ncbi:MAG: MBL fold metallo-hydrolase [Fibrobacter sp.]|nr:MBL fold metallo-hydrolase [Fibrobacter sp.]
MKTQETKTLKAKFIGACQGVTGSCTYLQFESHKFLVDCGMAQGEAQADAYNEGKFPFNPKDLDFVVLTHAHLDHSGLIPRLVREGFNGQVYATAATKELAKIILHNSVHIAQKDRANRQKAGGQITLYEHSHVNGINWRVVDGEDEFSWNQNIDLVPGLEMRFLRQSHILGAVSVQFFWDAEIAGTIQARSLLITGDVGVNSQKFAPQSMLRPRHEAEQWADYVVCESTYGGKTHAPEVFSNRILSLQKHLEDQNTKTLIIPGFAMHRMQEVLFDLFIILRYGQLKNQRKVMVTFDSNLAEKVNAVYSKHLFGANAKVQHKWLSKETRSHLREQDAKRYWKDSVKMFAQLLKQGLEVGTHWFGYENLGKQVAQHFDLQVVLATAGMCDRGPVNDYLFDHYADPHAKILLIGYQAPNTRGHRLQRLGEQQKKTPKKTMQELFGNKKSLIEYIQQHFQNGRKEEYITFSKGKQIVRPKWSEIQAQVETLHGYSSHADTLSLIDFVLPPVTQIAPAQRRKQKTVFLVHGGATQKAELKQALEVHGQKEFGPESAHPVDLQVEIPPPNSAWFNFNTNAWES